MKGIQYIGYDILEEGDRTMGLNDTPSANRVHIGFFGRRNAGKSSLVNAVTGQQLAVVSDVMGTTTDPVMKSMELLPLGPVVIIDTPGIDDEGELGELRVKKTREILEKTDIAVLVVDVRQREDEYEKNLIEEFVKREIPYIRVFNKCDLLGSDHEKPDFNNSDKKTMYVSSTTGEGIEKLKECMARLLKAKEMTMQIVGDLLHPMDVVVLVIPIDASAPKGRLILPQQQVIRDILEAGAISVVVKDTELKDTFDKLFHKPYMVITDSQAFGRVAEITPTDVYLTSFSILMARWKGFLQAALAGAHTLDDIHDGDRILIAEGCTHHRQCEDIGTVKLPGWIRNYTGAEPEFTFTSGGEFPEDLSGYKLVIHCGGCMLNERAMRYRMNHTLSCKVPFTNYGTAIAKMNGILERSVEVITDAWEKEDNLL